MAHAEIVNSGEGDRGGVGCGGHHPSTRYLRPGHPVVYCFDRPAGVDEQGGFAQPSSVSPSAAAVTCYADALAMMGRRSKAIRYNVHTRRSNIALDTRK